MYLLDWDNDELISFYYIGFGWWFGYQKKDTTRTSRSYVYAFGDNEWVHRRLVKDVTPLYCLSKSQILARTKILSYFIHIEPDSVACGRVIFRSAKNDFTLTPTWGSEV